MQTRKIKYHRGYNHCIWLPPFFPPYVAESGCLTIDPVCQIYPFNACDLSVSTNPQINKSNCKGTRQETARQQADR
jgi:hypothetical protein